MRTGPLTIVLAVVACGNSADEPGSPHSTRPPAAPVVQAKDCTTAANRAAAFLTAMDHDPSLVFLDGVSPPARTDLRHRESELHQTPLVEIRAKEIVYQSEHVLRPALEAKLADAEQRIRADIAAGRVPRNDPPDPAALIVVADEHAPWAMVVEVVEVAHHAGFDHVSFVFRRPAATPPPPHTHIDDEIAKLMKDTEAGNKATAFAEFTRPRVQACPALVDLFGQVSSAEHDDPTDYLLSHVGPALIQCNCAVDPADMVSLFWNLAGNPHPLGFIAVALDPTQVPIAAAADASWGDANKLLSVATASAWFAVRR